jgi:cell division cycle 14
MTDQELSGAHEIIPDRLYYVPLRATPRARSDAHFFSTDNELVYWNFFLDFGPLNLGQFYRFCQKLNAKLADPKLSTKRIYYYSGTHGHRRANSSFLVAAWSCVFLKLNAEQAYQPFKNVYPPFPPFHDASPCICTYNSTVMDCLRGFVKALNLGHYEYEKFDVEEYEYYEKVENGDFNWITKKFLAFAGPHETHDASPDGYHTLTPADYIPYFKAHNVTLVVRLNKKYYNEKHFKDAGIDHVDIYYLDGSTPPERLLRKFLDAAEATPGAVAVHCKAGLGRTGTCMGAYHMKHEGWSAAEWIGWNRICRPGSIIGPQQHYMKEMEAKLWKWGEQLRGEMQAERDAKRGSAAPSIDTLDLGSRGSRGGIWDSSVSGGGAALSVQAQSPAGDVDRTQGDNLNFAKRSPHASDRASGGGFSSPTSRATRPSNRF